MPAYVYEIHDARGVVVATGRFSSEEDWGRSSELTLSGRRFRVLEAIPTPSGAIRLILRPLERQLA